MALKFPLKMSDGTQVRTIEELREHFDLEAVLGYYSNGRLAEWLEARYYDEEAGKVRALKASSKKLKQNLCEILGVSYSEKVDKGLDIDSIAKGNERRECLKKYTTNDKILDAADSVAFNQSELDDLLKGSDTLETDDEGNKVIYLCGEQFIVPSGIGGIIYKGINNPTAKFDGGIIKPGIDLQDLKCDMSGYIKDCNKDRFYEVFENNLSLGLKLLRQEADRGNADAQFVFGLVCPDDEEPMEWWQKAADQGHIDANIHVYHFRLIFGLEGEEAKEAVRWFKKAIEYDSPYVEMIYGDLGKCYIMGMGVEQDFIEAIQYLKRSVKIDEDNGWETSAEVQYYLGYCYYYGKGVEQDYSEAVKWLQLASDQDDTDAEMLLGMCYEFGRGVKKDSAMAVEMYRKGAERYNTYALYLLGCCYFEGEGVEKNYKEAAKWIQSAIDFGYEGEDAKRILDICKWRQS